MSKIEAAIETAELIQQLSLMDCCVSVCDAEGTVVCGLLPKTFSLPEGSGVGKKVPTAGAMSVALSKKEKVIKVLPKEVLGVPAKVIAVPIYDGGNLAGVISLTITLDTQNSLMEAAHTIAATSEQIVATTEELAANAAALSENLGKLQNKGENVLAEINKTDSVLQFVSDVASNSRLLGLNASIEAARAGQAGKGFAVVAGEIGKMAESSAKAVKDIKAILTSSQRNTNDMVETIRDIKLLGERQADATTEISAALQNLSSSASDIEKVAEVV